MKRIDLFTDQLPPPIEDVEAWCEEVLERETIEALAKDNRELFLSFVATLGEVVLKRRGLDITELKERE